MNFAAFIDDLLYNNCIFFVYFYDTKFNFAFFVHVLLSGSLSRDEVKNIMAQLNNGVEPGPDEVKNAFQAMDRDGIIVCILMRNM